MMEEIQFRAVADAPTGAVDTVLCFSLQSIINTKSRKPAVLASFLTAMPDRLEVVYNGSFHEYDFDLLHCFKAKRWNPKGYDSASRWSLYEGDRFYDDFNVFYVPKYALAIIEKYRETTMWGYPTELSKTERGTKPIRKADVPELIQAETEKAVQAWKMSKENY